MASDVGPEKDNNTDNDPVGGRLALVERELYAVRSSSSWTLAQRIHRLLSGLRRLTRGNRPAPGFSVRVETVGSEIVLTVQSTPGVGPTEFVLSLSVGPTELLQQEVRLLTHQSGDDSDISVLPAGEGLWRLVWRPSTPIGDYHPGELRLRVGGFPDWVVSVAPDATTAPPATLRHRSGRASIDHLLNSIREIRVVDTARPIDGRKVAVISTFTPAGRPLGAVVELLREVRDAGFLTIVVDTSPDWRLGSSDMLGEIASVYVRRANIGWDFSSWITAHTHPELAGIVDGASEVLWLNDSCYGPLSSMSALMEGAGASGHDLWGLTSSNQIKPHVQSFLLRFSRRALDAGLVDEFIAGYPFPIVKSDIILEGEVRLTEVAKALGLSVGVAYPYEDVVDRYLATWDERLERLHEDPLVRAFSTMGQLSDCVRYMYHLILREAVENGIPRNASHEMWDTLLDMGFPMIKRELVVSNPQKVPINDLPRRVADLSPAWADIIHRERSIDG